VRSAARVSLGVAPTTQRAMLPLRIVSTPANADMLGEQIDAEFRRLNS